MVVGTIFQANLNADKIYIDLTYLPDPIKHKFWLTIRNQSLSTLYFKIICDIPNWTLDTPADGKLGSVGAGAAITFTPIITRAKPASETEDSGSLKIEAYTDSDYTNKMAEDTLDVTVYIEDLESWTDVIKSDFDDGTAQGWTLSHMNISSTQSVEAGGYSAQFYSHSQYTYNIEASISKSLTLPNRNKVRISFFLAYSIAAPARYVNVHDLSVMVDDVKIFDLPFKLDRLYSQSKKVGWVKVAADLSDYKGQTVTLKLRMFGQLEESGLYATVYIWFDRIVVAGKD